MAAQTRKPIEIDLSGIDLDGIKTFVQEGSGDSHGMQLGSVPPCVFPCSACTPCAACSTSTSIAPPR